MRRLVQRMFWPMLWGLPIVLSVLSWYVWIGPALHSRSTLLIAPMMDLTACLLAEQRQAGASAPENCKDSTSAAPWVEGALASMVQPGLTPKGMQWGYTLKVPLLNMLKPVEDSWQPDQSALRRVVSTLTETGRPAVLYLFSTHFAVGAEAEQALAKDPQNLAQTTDGALAQDRYYGHPVYPWSVARTDNGITRAREAVIRALVQEICIRPDAVRQLRGITLLGEVHHLFPKFESGMGFGGGYHITDYSEASRVGFRRYLANRFGDIASFNQATGGRLTSFEQVEPPSQDLRSNSKVGLLGHMDAFAAGRFPVTGWVHMQGLGQPVRVHVLLNGKRVAAMRADLSRQDVSAAKPEFGHADVGWRHDIDFRKMTPGRHRIDVLVEPSPGVIFSLGARHVRIADSQGAVPSVDHGQAPLLDLQPLPDFMQGYLDEPSEMASFIFNPLAQYWLEFRQQQVFDYLAHFSRLLNGSCLQDIPRYTHQIVPHFNPGWDFDKFAVDLTLKPSQHWHAGLSLYGATSYGPQLPAWLKQMGHQQYGITEFHPLRAMSEQELGVLLQRHRSQGARFVSFFLDTRHEGKRLAEANPFSFELDNPQFASDRLAQSMTRVMAPQPLGTRP